MEHHQQIVEKLESARDERGVSKFELARRAEVNPRRLMLILEGKRSMRADEFVRVCLEMSIPVIAFYGKVIEDSIHRDGMLYRVVVDSESGEFLGECDIHDTREEEWGISIKILKDHWRKGVGRRAMELFLSEMRESFR